MSTNAGMTVYVVDDDQPVRASLRELLESVDLRVRDFEGGSAFLENLNGGEAGCVLLDIRMPGMSGIEVQAELIARGMGMPIIFVTGHGDVQVAVRAVLDGASDFIEKPFRAQKVLDCVGKALAAESQRVSERARREEFRRKAADLTPRECEIMKLTAAGDSAKGIAAMLGLSPKTVRIHRARAMKKMGAGSAVELARMVEALAGHARKT